MGTGIQNRNWIELQLHQQACISIPGKLDQVLSLPCFGVPTLTPKLLSGALQLQTPALLLTPYHSAPLFTWYHLHRFSINFDVTSALSPEVREDLLINPSIILNLLMNTSPFFSLGLSFPSVKWGDGGKMPRSDSHSLKAIRNEGSLTGELGALSLKRIIWGNFQNFTCSDPKSRDSGVKWLPSPFLIPPFCHSPGLSIPHVKHGRGS